MPSESEQPLLDGEAAPASAHAVNAARDPGDAEARDGNNPCDSGHYSDRAPWLRAAVLGANDGLVSVASIMLGVGASQSSHKQLILSGTAALVAGAMSMAVGEYISVSSQRDTEQADLDKERAEHRTPAGRAHELEELTQIYCDRGLSYDLARQVAEALTRDDVIRAHARDELGIDIDNLANPWQAAFSSLICFALGGGIPLLAGLFVRDAKTRILLVVAGSTLGLALFGAIGAWLGGARRLKASVRVLLGGWLAFLVTYGVGRLFGTDAA